MKKRKTSLRRKWSRKKRRKRRLTKKKSTRKNRKKRSNNMKRMCSLTTKTLRSKRRNPIRMNMNSKATRSRHRTSKSLETVRMWRVKQRRTRQKPAPTTI